MFRIIPLGDLHVGAAACNEAHLKNVVKAIAKSPNTYWIGMGDYCEFITMQDPRFDVGGLAEWITIADLADIAKVQRDRLMDHLRPIAGKCLALIEGNHERQIRRHTERDIYREIVAMVKGEGGFKSEDKLGLGMVGWLQLVSYRSQKRERMRRFDISLHHGFTGGKLAGAKALNMQRWLWTHAADLALMGHSHNTAIQPEAVEALDITGKIIRQTRVGAYTGTFFETAEDGPATYAEERGFFPLPRGGVEIKLRPHAKHHRLRLIYAT